MPTLKFSLSLWLACILRQRPVWSHNGSVMDCEGTKYKGKILCGTPFKRRSEKVRISLIPFCITFSVQRILRFFSL